MPKLSLEDPLAGLTSATFLRNALELRGWIGDSLTRDVRVHRREGTGAWRPIVRVRADRMGQVAWRDSTVRRGRTVEYALEVRTVRGPRLVPLPSISIPAERLLRVVARADGGGTVTLAIELPTAQPATLELFDVAGRRLGSVDLAGRSAGRHEVTVSRTLLPSSGVYFVRLQQAGAAPAEAKLVVAR